MSTKNPDSPKPRQVNVLREKLIDPERTTVISEEALVLKLKLAQLKSLKFASIIEVQVPNFKELDLEAQERICAAVLEFRNLLLRVARETNGRKPYLGSSELLCKSIIMQALNSS